MRRIRKLNIVLAGHVDHGKSTLIEAITGKFPDTHRFEIKKNMTVFLKVISFKYNKWTTINFIDTPGHADFRAAVNIALIAADGVVLVVSGVKGFQARSEYILRQALKYNKPVIIAITKMDIPTADEEKVIRWLQKENLSRIHTVPVSAKKGIGINNLLNLITSFFRLIRRYKTKSSFIVLGFKEIKGIGSSFFILLKRGILSRGQIIDNIEIKEIYDINLKRKSRIFSGDLAYVILNDKSKRKIDIGTVISEGGAFKEETLTEGIYTSKIFRISIKNPKQFQIAERILHNLSKDSLGLKIERKRDMLQLSVVGDLQFELALEKLRERKIDFEVKEEQENEIITVANRVKVKTKSAIIELIPRSRKGVIVERFSDETKDFDVIGVVTAAQSLGVQGLYAIVYEGNNADDIAELTAKAIEKSGLIKIIQSRSILVKSNFPRKVQEATEEVGGVVTSSTKTDIFVIIPAVSLDDFITKVMHKTQGNAEIQLIRLEHNERVLAIDPGMRHIGFAYLEGDEIPEIWHINLEWHLDERRLGDKMLEKIKNEIMLFLKDKSPPTKVFVGSGIGSEFIIKVIRELFQDTSTEIFFVDEKMSTREALFKLKSNHLERVKAKSLVDHGIAALLIARRGLSGNKIKVTRAVEKVQSYISANYPVGVFKRLAHIQSLKDLTPGVYLRVRDPSFFKTKVMVNEVFVFRKMGVDKSLVVTSLSGRRIILKWRPDINPERVFLQALAPGKGG